MKAICMFVGLFGLCSINAFAGSLDFGTPAAANDWPFQRGAWDIEAGAGELGSFSTSSAKRPTVDYQLDDLRLGWMYDSPRRPGWLRGNNELMLELFAGPVTKGPGSYLGGASLLWRYNFVQPAGTAGPSGLTPYCQLGIGALDNDVFTGRAQKEIGEAFEFELLGGLGLKYRFHHDWAISLEADYRHISNAGLSSRNEGLNSIGGLMQVSYFFR